MKYTWLLMRILKINRVKNINSFGEISKGYVYLCLFLIYFFYFVLFISNKLYNTDNRISKTRDHHEIYWIVLTVPDGGGHVCGLYGFYGPRVRRSRAAAFHTGHAPAANAVVFGRRLGGTVGQQRNGLAQGQGATDGHPRVELW